MWLSLLATLLTYLLSSRGTASERRNALVKAAVVGGGTYAATQYTDWGKDASDRFDGVIGVPEKKTTLPAGQSYNANGDVVSEDGTVVTKAPTGAIGSPNKTPSAGGSLWSSLASWGPATTALVAGSAAAALAVLPSWIFPVALAIGAFVLIK